MTQTIKQPETDALLDTIEDAHPVEADWAVMAEFEDVDSLLHAAQAVRDRGFTRWDCHTPFPVHHLDGAMGMRPTILPWLVLGAGLTGASLGVFFQLYTMSTEIEHLPSFLQGYKMVISGKPYQSGPAYVPITFELTILLSALTAFGGMLLLNRLPWLYNPLFKSAKFRRATDDRFFVVIRTDDPVYEEGKTIEMLKGLDALSVEAVTETVQDEEQDDDHGT